jgi:glycerol-3-phosphate dehydrogenase
MKHVNMLYQRGLNNNVLAKDMKVINKRELLKREPLLNKKVFGALVCTSS